MSGKIFHEPGCVELLLLLPLVSGEIPGFHNLCQDPAAARAGKGLLGMCWDLAEPGSRSALPQEQDVPGPASVLAQAGAVLVGCIHHRGSWGCKYRLGQCEIVMAIRSCQDTSKALCSSLGMLGSLAHGGGCVKTAALLDESCLTQNLSF